MNGIVTILKIRTLQALRMLKDVGWLLLLLVAPLVFVFVLSGLETIADQNSELPLLLAAAVLFGIHFKRDDKAFLERLKMPSIIIYFAEYFYAVTPFFLLVSLATGRVFYALCLYGIALLVALVPVGLIKKKDRAGNWSLSAIPVNAFEWKSGLRKHWPSLLLMYFIPLFLSYFTASILVGMLLTTVTISAFYIEVEGKEIFEETAHPFLWSKILSHSKLLHAFFIPHYVLFLMLHSSYWYLLLYMSFVTQAILVFLIFFKYAQYHPRRIVIYNQTQLAIAAMCLVIPILWPAGIFFLVLYGRRAVNNLDQLYV